jgi:undecaprenyl pyrophosphate synthase
MLSYTLSIFPLCKGLPVYTERTAFFLYDFEIASNGFKKQREVPYTVTYLYFQFLFGETLNHAYAGKYRVRFIFCRQFLKREKADFVGKREEKETDNRLMKVLVVFNFAVYKV